MPVSDPITIIAIDPGRSKSGVAVVSGPAPVKVHEHAVVESDALTESIGSLLVRHPTANSIVVGNGTGSADAIRGITKSNPDLKIVLADERSTSERARARFLAAEELPLVQRLLPKGLRSPHRPYDDYVAIILAERYFAGLLGGR